MLKKCTIKHHFIFHAYKNPYQKAHRVDLTKIEAFNARPMSKYGRIDAYSIYVTVWVLHDTDIYRYVYGCFYARPPVCKVDSHNYSHTHASSIKPLITLVIYNGVDVQRVCMVEKL